MKNKLKCILLIDDDEATNFLHEITIKKLDCTEKIVTKTNGLEAIKYLTTKEVGAYPQPELIFLDINMPIMDGWRFLEKYRELEECQKGKMVVVMLTTSLNPDDKKRAENIIEISGYKSKPLTAKMLENILNKYFQDEQTQAL